MNTLKSSPRDMSDIGVLTLMISALWVLLTVADLADSMLGEYMAGRDIQPGFALMGFVVSTTLSVMITPLLIYLLRLVERGGRLRATAWLHFIGVVLAVAVLRNLMGRVVGSVLMDRALTWEELKMSLLLMTHSHALDIAIAGAVILVYDNAHADLERERLRTALTVSRMQQLRAQFRPHFLLNTLNTIATLVHRDPRTADDLITSLGTLLRWTLDVDDVAEIPLGEELQFVRDYLTIQQVRFGPRLEASIDVVDDALRCSVPPQILQPLVENAIIHGLPHAHPTGRVRITARIDCDALVLKVCDSGAGDPVSVSRGVGLRNLEERLTTMYGEKGTLSFRSEANEFVAEVRIPARAVEA